MRRTLLVIVILVIGLDMLTRRLLMAGPGAAFAPPVITPNVFSLSAPAEGGWSWFGDPRAVYYNGRTYFGYINSDGDPTVRSYDHSTATTNTLDPDNRLHIHMEEDDHDNPSLLIRDSDHKLLAFYSRHSGAQMFLRISATSLDTDPDLSDGFAAEVNLDSQLGGVSYTYPNVVQLTGEADDPIYLFYRDPVDDDTTAMRLSKSTDGGATWSAQSLIFRDTGRSAYWKVATNGVDRIDFGVSDGHPFFDADVSIGHFYYEGGAYFETDGSSAGAIPIDFADITQIYNGATHSGWIWDVAFDGTDPRVVFVTYPNDDGTDHRYQYASWDGAAWDVNEVALGGGTIHPTEYPPGISQEWYSGGVVLDHTDPNIVYASREVGGTFEMYRYVTADGGASFSEEALTSDSADDHIRPVSVRNGVSDLRVLWAYGTYTTYVDFSLGVMGSAD